MTPIRTTTVAVLSLMAIACSLSAPATSNPTVPPADTPSTGPTASPTTIQTTAPTPTATPTVSPVGSCSELFDATAGRVAFTIGNGRANGIATVNADGSGFQLILEPVDIPGQPHGGTEGPRWTPDGRIVFASNRSGGPDDWHILVVDAGRGDPIQLTGGDDGIEYNPVISVDGSTLVYSKAVSTPDGPEPFRDAGIFVSDSDGLNERQLTSTPNGAVDEWPDISPDGEQVVFTRGHVSNGGLYIVNMDGSGLRQLIDGEFEPLRPRWSPDGKSIVLHGNGTRFLTESANVWVVAPDGSGLRQLTRESVPSQAWAADWSPDGEHIVYVHTKNTSTALDVIGLDGTPTCSLYRGASATTTGWDPDWGPAADPVSTDLVGEWVRDTRCEEIVARLTDAGMDGAVLDYASAFIPVASGPDDIADPSKPCEGAVPLQHSHFFTADGRFGSRNENGAQVDTGTYRIVDSNTFVISNEFDDVTFHYEIDGNRITFEPVIPDCRPECFEAVWSLTVAYPGLPWTRAE